MRIIVTGGAGFIGSHVVDAYLGLGHKVAVIDNLSSGMREQVSADAALYEADICDAQEVRRIFADFRPDVVNHHAAQIDVRVSVDNPVFDAETNILGTLNVLKASLDFKVTKIMYASSGGAIYGEPQYLPADERHPICPCSEYGISKHTVEHYLEVYARNYGLNYTVLRYANVYGPRQNLRGEAGVIAIFIAKMLAGETPVIYGDGEAVRDYVCVEDVARANALALTQASQQAVNIGTCTGTSVNALYRLLAGMLAFPHAPQYAPARVGEISCTFLDAQYAAEVLGWQPKVSLHDGIARTVEYARREVYVK